MYSKWIDKYQVFSQKWRFISKLGTFVFTLTTIFSLYGFGWTFYFNDLGLNDIFGDLKNEPEFLISITFQVSLLLVFATRFGLNFFDQKRIFWLNQLLWLGGLLLLIAYWGYPRPKPPLEFTSYHESIFSSKFELIGVSYLFLSPLLRISFAIISFVKSLKRECQTQF
jgi:Na+/melibiose symporter-like transporter